MPNMDPKKCPMPSQEPNVRNKNFKEVALGYTEEMAVNEAKRCLQCKNHPCRSGCPVEIDIPGFIKHVAEGDFEAAYNVIAQSSALPAVCGRVCPQEHQCEGKCVRGIKGEAVGIGRLERFVADWYRNNVHTKPTAPAPNGHKVAVIGAGPSGLTVAGDLAKLGYKVTVYEALHVAGGVLMYGIPEFRLPKAIVQREVENLKKMGVDIELNMVIGKVLTITELFYGGAFACLPLLWGLASLPLARRRLAAKRDLRTFVVVVLAAMLVLAVLDCQMAGMLYRYQSDWLGPLLLAAALAWALAEQVLQAHAAQSGIDVLQRAFCTILPLAVLAGACYSFCVYFTAEPGLIGQNPALYQNVSRLVQFWL